MAKEGQNMDYLPDCITEYIKLVVKKMRYRRKVRREVARELVDHFIDALAECKNENEKEELARKLIDEFGDAKMLAKLIRRGKKRCRPMWKKALIRFVQCLMVVYVLACVYNAWIMYTWRNAKTDHVKMLNELNRPVISEKENARKYYEKAFELYVEIPEDLKDVINKCSSDKFANFTGPLLHLNDKQKESLRQWLKDNEPTWQQVIGATELKYYWWDITGVTPDDVSEKMKRMSLFRALAKMGRWRARQYAVDKQIDKAMEDSLTIVKMGRHILSGKLLIEYLNGLGVNNCGEMIILEIMKEYTIENSCLTKVQKELEEIFSDSFLMYDLQGEAFYSMATLKWMINNINKKPTKWIFPITLLAFGSFEETESETLRFFEEIDKGYSFEQMSTSNTIDDKTFPIVRYKLFELIKPAIDSTMSLSYRGKALHEAVVTVLALKRWQLEKGEYPESLQELLDGGYLKRLPDDPYSEGILKYQKRGDDFVLYSLGEDFEDDQGAQNTDIPWHGSGDYVFWPVPVR